jgi:hypothetical protein
MVTRTFIEESQLARTLIENEPSLKEKLKKYRELEILDNRGNFHMMYRLGSITHQEEEFHFAVRTAKRPEYFVNPDLIEVAQGDLEHCAQQYQKIYDNPNGNLLVPKFAIGVSFDEFSGTLGHRLLITEDLTHGGKRRFERDIPPDAAQFDGLVYCVDFDLLSMGDEIEAKEYAEKPLFFSKDYVINLSL